MNGVVQMNENGRHFYDKNGMAVYGWILSLGDISMWCDGILSLFARITCIINKNVVWRANGRLRPVKAFFLFFLNIFVYCVSRDSWGFSICGSKLIGFRYLPSRKYFNVFLISQLKLMVRRVWRRFLCIYTFIVYEEHLWTYQSIRGTYLYFFFYYLPFEYFFCPFRI